MTAVFAGDAVTVDYTAPAGESESRLQDQVGNAAASFSGRSVTNRTPAAVQLTASAHDVPANHDGRTTFTFELRFSENAQEGLQLQDPAGQRLHRDGRRRGEGAAAGEGQERPLGDPASRPDGNGTVTIVLPMPPRTARPTGPSAHDDGRMLSNRLEITVPGPGG